MRNFGGETSWKEVGCEDGRWMQVAQDLSQWRVVIFSGAECSSFVISVELFHFHRYLGLISWPVSITGI
jgi:hypothetical protein